MRGVSDRGSFAVVTDTSPDPRTNDCLFPVPSLPAAVLTARATAAIASRAALAARTRHGEAVRAATGAASDTDRESGRTAAAVVADRAGAFALALLAHEIALPI